MTRIFKWLAAIVLLLVMLLVGVAVALHLWVGSEDFRERTGRQLSQVLGVPVVLGAITVDVWPLPAVAVDKVQIKSQPPLTLERIEARPLWAPLLKGRLEVSTLLVRHAVVPEQAVAALGAVFQKRGPATDKGAEPAGQPGGGMTFLPRRTVLDQVTWVHAKGGSTTVDAQARLDDDGLPASAELAITQGRLAGARATLQREAGHWALLAHIGGGTVKGKMQFTAGAAKGASLLQGEFDTANVELAALTAPSRTLTGQIDAHTTLRSEFRDPGTIADVLQSQTRFTVRHAVVHGIDLAAAVKSVGQNRGGQTQLDTLTGHVATQGKTVQLTNLVAASGALSANGNVAMSTNRSLSGRLTVDVASSAVGGTIGVPLVVGGTLDSPSVTVSRAALLGAAVGTLVTPGVGTAAGAKAGDRLGESLRGLLGK
jgi:hypothetical protein